MLVAHSGGKECQAAGTNLHLLWSDKSRGLLRASVVVERSDERGACI